MTHDTHAKPRSNTRETNDASRSTHARDPRSDMHDRKEHARGAYLRLAIMAVLSFAAMYALMYAMVDRFANVYANIDQAYMAALMTAPMIVIELLLMSGMYANKRANAALITLSLVIGAGAFFALREQSAINDRQFLLAMIPHHGAAVLMCQQAQITDPEIQRLCFAPNGIVASQQREIDQMKAMLARG